jgi:hypothetical protein
VHAMSKVYHCELKTAELGGGEQVRNDVNR